MATLAFNDTASTETRPHPYSIAGSYRASSVCGTHGCDIRPSFNNSPPAPATVPPPTPSRSASLAVRTTSANRTSLRKRLSTTRILDCVGSSHIDDDHCQHITSAHNIEPIADINEQNFNRSFFEGMNKGHRVSKRKASLGSMLSLFASICDHLTPPPMAKPPKSEQLYHYQKRSLRRAMSFHDSDIEEPSPDEHNVGIVKRRAGAFGTAIRAIESASYIPASPCSINTPDRSSGSCPFGFDDIDSACSGSIYSPISSPAPTVHRVLPPIEDKEEDRAEEIPQEAPQEYGFEQRLVKRSASFDSHKPPTSPLSPFRPQIVSFSRPTPQVYPYLSSHATVRQESSHQVARRSPTSPTRINVPLEATSEHCSAPLSPPLPNRNPRRTPGNSGHGPLIHATLNQPFLGGQDKLDVFTPGPRTIMLKQPTPPPSSWQRKPLTSIGKRI